jgi:hypothetical protein
MWCYRARNRNAGCSSMTPKRQLPEMAHTAAVPALDSSTKMSQATRSSPPSAPGSVSHSRFDGPGTDPLRLVAESFAPPLVPSPPCDQWPRFLPHVLIWPDVAKIRAVHPGAVRGLDDELDQDPRPDSLSGGRSPSPAECSGLGRKYPAAGVEGRGHPATLWAQMPGGRRIGRCIVMPSGDCITPLTAVEFPRPHSWRPPWWTTSGRGRHRVRLVGHDTHFRWTGCSPAAQSAQASPVGTPSFQRVRR